MLWELTGLSSNVPSTVGLSRDAGRLFGDSIDLERFSDALERLEDWTGSPDVALRLVLLNDLQTDGRSESCLLFCRIKLSNLLRREDVFEVKEPLAEGFERWPFIDP